MKNMKQTLILIRGLPGAGKSTLAKKMIGDGDANAHFEADQYFYRNGSYAFDPTLLPEAHNYCLTSTKCALESGKSVVVANTFVKREHLAPYLQLAKRLSCKVRVIKCTGNFKSIHNVPQATIARMRKEWEDL